MNRSRRLRHALCVLLLLASAPAIAQQVLGNLTVGRSTRKDVEKVFGKPVSEPSRTLIEYRAPESMRSEVSKIYVQYRQDSKIADRIEALLLHPQERGRALAGMGLPQVPLRTSINARGKFEEYYGAPMFMVLTYAYADADSGVLRAARYSPELFDRALQELEKQ